jgi:glycosyltransferase involved in cell wall biosynthesis
MRVVMVCRKYSGVDRQMWLPSGTPAVIKLIEEFERRGHQTTVLFLSKTPDNDSDARDLRTSYNQFKHVTFVFVGWRGLRGVPAMLSDIINDMSQLFLILPYLVRRADILYFDRTHLAYAALSSLFRRNVVWRCLGVMSFVIARDAGKRAGAIYLQFARILVCFPIKLMVCTNDGSPWFRVFQGASRRRLLLLTNGVDRNPRAEERAGGSTAVPLIGFVGRATQAKGLDIFVAMCAELMRRKIPFRAVIVGDGHLRESAARTVEEKGLGHVVEFTGRVPHARIAEYFRAIDIYVTPARNGTFSNTTIEALAAGCGVVALSPSSDTGVDRTTMAFLPADVVRWARRDSPAQSVADAVVDLLAAPDLLAERRRRIRAFATVAIPKWSERIRREADLFESIVQSQPVPHGAIPEDILARKAYEIVP